MIRLRLQHRIVIPFLVVVLLATTGAAVVALSVTSRALQARVRAQLSSAVAVVSRGDLALNRLILENLRGIIGADVVTFGPAGEVLASTVGADRQPVIAAAARAIARSGGAPAEALVVDGDCGAPCLVAHRAVEGRPGVAVALVADTSELAEATGTVTRAIVLGAVASAVVMIVVGQLVVRRVTSPLQQLVRFARELSPQDEGRRAPVGDDEIGGLAEAFNGMLDRLQQSRVALVRSEKLAVAGLMAARVAHDIRNPLASMKLQMQMLQARTRRDPDDSAAVTAVLHDIEQVEAVVQNLVEAARPGDLRREPAGVNDVLRGALQQLAPQFAHRKIGVRTQLADALPALALDVVRFRQAILNLLVNASEAMASGGEITVASGRQGSDIVIEICDDGAGIDPAIADQVFDPFFSTKREGVGLGLMNARAVVEGHGGRIVLSARRPTGTCASIALPVRDG